MRLEGECLAHEADPCAVCDTGGQSCQECGRLLPLGVSAWASDWTVITPEGVTRETRYTCDDCA